METLPKVVPESMIQLTVAVSTLAGFRKMLVFCELGFARLLAGFSKPDMTVNILSASSVAY